MKRFRGPRKRNQIASMGSTSEPTSFDRMDMGRPCMLFDPSSGPFVVDPRHLQFATALVLSHLQSQQHLHFPLDGIQKGGLRCCNQSLQPFYASPRQMSPTLTHSFWQADTPLFPSLIGLSPPPPNAQQPPQRLNQSKDLDSGGNGQEHCKPCVSKGIDNASVLFRIESIDQLISNETVFKNAKKEEANLSKAPGAVKLPSAIRNRARQTPALRKQGTTTSVTAREERKSGLAPLAPIASLLCDDAPRRPATAHSHGVPLCSKLRNNFKNRSSPPNALKLSRSVQVRNPTLESHICSPQKCMWESLSRLLTL